MVEETPDINDEELDALLDNVLSDLDNVKLGKTGPKLVSEEKTVHRQLLESEERERLDKRPSKSPVDFQDRIDDRLNMLKETSAEIKGKLVADAQLSSEGTGADPLSDMMKKMESMLDSEEFDSMLDNVMDSLMTKSVLYEPLSDLAAAYDPWLETNSESLNKEQLIRYRGQKDCLFEILKIYRSVPEGKETTDEQNKSVVEWLDKMQKFGDPPAEILSKFAPDMQIGPDGNPSSNEFDKLGLAGLLAGSSSGASPLSNPETCTVM